MSDLTDILNRKRRRRVKGGDDSVEMQMGPMIDMVFLLLVFFMVTAKPIEPESDINIALPGKVEQSEAIDLPDEQRIVIQADGQVVLNDLALDSRASQALPELVAVLKRFKEAAEANRSQALVTVAPQPTVPHQRIVDVLNACAVAEIRGVSFDTSTAGNDAPF